MSEQTIRIQAEVAAVNLFLSDRLLDLDKPISVKWNEKTVFEGRVERSAAAIERSFDQRLDKELAAPVILELRNN